MTWSGTGSQVARERWEAARRIAGELVGQDRRTITVDDDSWDNRGIRGLLTIVWFAVADLHDLSPEKLTLAEVAINLESPERIRDIVTSLLASSYDLSGSDPDDPVGMQWAWLTRSWTPEHELPPIGNPLRARYRLWDGLPRGIARGLPDPAVSVLAGWAEGIVLRALADHCATVYGTFTDGTAVRIISGDYEGAEGVIRSPGWERDPDPYVFRYLEEPTGYAVRLSDRSLAPDTFGEVMVPAEAVEATENPPSEAR